MLASRADTYAFDGSLRSIRAWWDTGIPCVDKIVRTLAFDTKTMKKIHTSYEIDIRWWLKISGSQNDVKESLQTRRR